MLVIFFFRVDFAVAVVVVLTGIGNEMMQHLQNGSIRNYLIKRNNNNNNNILY